MLIDARTLSNGETIETEVCIIGAGPAGMTLAREFIEQDFRVCLLESGGLEVDAETQALNEGETTGDYYTPLHEIRRRQCGGTANAWDIELSPTQKGVRYVPLDPIDFEKRDWLPYSGWAFGRSHLDPYYERAQETCQAGPFKYAAADWESPQACKLPFASDRVNTGMFQFGSSAVFAQEYRDQVIQSRHITLCHHANAVEIETNDTARAVTGVRVACLSGGEFRIAARIVILAAGSIENIRLLLLSNRVQKAGLGNQYDQVGRFFMDHPLVFTGTFVPSDRSLFNSTALYDWQRINGTLVMGMLKLTEKAMQAEHLLNMNAILFPRYPGNQSEAVRALKRLLGRGKKLELFGQSKNLEQPHSKLQDLLQVATGMHEIFAGAYKELTKQPLLTSRLSQGGWSELSHKERRFGYYDVYSPTEQAPDPDNRVTLSDRRDRLGSQMAKVEWRWLEDDIRSVKRSQEILAEEIARAGLGQLQIGRDGEKPLLASPGMHHPLGGTRIHNDPKQGVVDETCQVHGVANLFITGGSVFPTGGFANPTLTVVALATRLADQVKQAMTLSEVTLLSRENISR
jgi:choline dehydrogenase-like flavoprotein